MTDKPSKPAPAAPQAAQADGGRRKGRGWLTAVIVLVCVVAGAGAGAGVLWWVLQGQPRAAVEKETTAQAPPVEQHIVSFDPFLVNLADGASSRFLRTTIQLVVAGPEEVEKAKSKDASIRMAQARSAVLELLTRQTADDLLTPEGKATLRISIATRVSELAPELQVSDVLFSDFVIQF